MTYLDNLLATVFSVNVGESADEQRAALERFKANPDRRQLDGLRRELGDALADRTYDWDTLLDHWQAGPDDGSDGRRFVVERMWVPLFGKETVPA